MIGQWDARAFGLGGWSLSVHHAYDPNGRVLYYGTGERRSARNLNAIVQVIAGHFERTAFPVTRFPGDAADGESALLARVSHIASQRGRRSRWQSLHCR